MPINRQTLADILKGMQMSVNTAQEMLQTQTLSHIGSYFDDSGLPVSKNITLPSGGKIDVPLISLVPQNVLAIDTVELEFLLKAEASDVEGLKEGVKSSVFDVSFAPDKEDVDNSNIRVKVVFKAKESTEGCCRLLQYFDKGF